MTENPTGIEPTKSGELTAEDIKRIAEAVPMPAGTGHYQMKGDWDEGRQVYTVHEKENIITEYKYAEKGQSDSARQMRKESYRLVAEKDGQVKRKPAEYDTKSGLWKDKNLLKRMFSRFAEAPIVIGTMVKDASGEGKVLHVLEAHRPVNAQIMPVEVKAPDDLKIELDLKQAHASEMKRRADVIQKKLKDKVDQANKEAWKRAIDTATNPRPPIPSGNI